ncbi:MAG TPA: hypothetical protein VE553_00740, partial [Candidatus Binatia bacterium]|nr:hypothetical protein [Candidatus Binatia bacterium]
MRFSRLFFTGRRRLLLGLALLLLLSVTVVLAAPGGMIIAPAQDSVGNPVAPGFLFELESAPGSLKGEPTWNELEQMLDDPYAIAYADPRLAEEVSGFPAYETTIQRRRSFLPPGCTYQDPVPAGLVACDDSILEPFLVHPLNYNHMNGEELRLLNPAYPGGPFDVPAELVQCGVGNLNESDFCRVETYANSIDGPAAVYSPPKDPNRYVWVYETVQVSPGADRVEETSIDFNSPLRPDVDTSTQNNYPPKYGDYVCMVGTEVNPPEGSVICGGDPGIPGYAGFGVYDSNSYSTPAIRGIYSPTVPIPLPIAGDYRLFDPGGCADRNAESSGSCDGDGFVNWLLRPTVRETRYGQPDYLQNSVANLALYGEDTLEASNENDYILGN